MAPHHPGAEQATNLSEPAVPGLPGDPDLLARLNGGHPGLQQPQYLVSTSNCCFRSRHPNRDTSRLEHRCDEP